MLFLCDAIGRILFCKYAYNRSGKTIKRITLIVLINMTQQLCPVCGHPTDPVHVHGHYQCTVCGINISPCCDGAQCEEENTAGTKAGDTKINPA
jgi:uncharacterized protein (UPF0212 family)